MLRKRLALLWAIITVCGLSLKAQTIPDDLTLWYDEDAADVFTNALPIGNGKIGGMIYGGAAKDKIGLNEGTIWSGNPGNNSRVVSGNLATARSQVFAGNYASADATMEKMMGGGQERFLPAGDLILDFTGHVATNYYRELNLKTAIAKTTYSYNGVKYTREYFASFPDKVLIVRLTADQPGKITYTASYASQLTNTISTSGNDLLLLNGQANAVKYQMRTKISNDGGTIAANGKTITVSGANSSTIILTIGTNFNTYADVTGDQVARATAIINAISTKTYDQLKATHLNDYQPLFKRVTFNVGAQSNASKLTTDLRVSNFATTDDPQLVKLHYQFGRYLMISCSRPGSQPANLQGIWNRDLYPSWGSKYTTNINFEMNYWMTETANLPECAIPFIDKVKAMVPNGRQAAKDVWGVNTGWVVHHNTDIWNRTAPIDGAWGLWPTGAGWLCLNLWEHYLFSKDQTYLADVYPTIKESAQFFLNSMVTETVSGNNYLVTCPSVSPEIEHNGDWSCFAPTMDIQIVRDVFNMTIKATEILNTDAALKSQVAAALAKLPPHKVGKYGQLQEWFQDWDNPNDKNRHVSHLYGLFPSNQLTVRGTPALITAAKTTLAQRGDDATGWSLAWKINFWARLEDGNHAYKLIKNLLTPAKTYNNLFDAHPPFQIDGNFGAVSGVNEMLVQSQNNEIQFLPALPTTWPAGFIKGIRARGGFEIDSLFWSGSKLDGVTLTSLLGEPLNVRYGTNTKTYLTVAGQKYKLDGQLNLVAVNAPIVTITAPVAAASFEAPANITINATATVANGTIAKVEFFNGQTKLGEDNTSPYSYTWTNVEAGSYSISAIATDNAGNKGTSSAVSVSVTIPQGSYSNTPWVIPGTIQCENYDLGGNGKAYNDISAGNTGGATFRTDEDVDIENCTDASSGSATVGNYNIGYATAGEWLEYTVNVSGAGTYNLTLRVACNGDNRTVSISAKDEVVAPNVPIPNTAGWQTWTDVLISDIPLDAGEQVIRITIGASDYVNLNYMTFALKPQPLPEIPLKKGWNLVGYPFVNDSEIATALSGIWDNVLVVKNNDSYYDKSQSATFNLLKFLKFSEGYYIKVDQDCILTWIKK